jgi:hypothetical protein
VKLLMIFAILLSIVGIGLFISGPFTNLGIALLIEGGVLFTLVDEQRRRGRASG